jgi:hypothetical protein
MTVGPPLDLSEHTMFAIHRSETQDRSLRPRLARPARWEAL